MTPVLEGQEVKKEYDGGAGVFIVDVDAQGEIVVSNSYKKDVEGFAEIESVTSLKTNIFTIAEKIAAKTATTWDDTAIKGLEALLGIKPPEG